jgi:uncharacterized protein YndB with AHSA1/START domain
MSVATWTIHVNRSPEQAFAYMTDLSRHHEWSPKPFSIEPVDGDWAAKVGNRFRSKGWILGNPQLEQVVEITRVEAPSRFAFTSTTRDDVTKNLFELTPEADGTRIVRTVEMGEYRGIGRVVFPIIFALVAKPGIQKGMNMLKEKLDRGV